MRIGALAAAVLFVALALTVARPPSTPGPPMRDFEAYYAAGATFAQRADPYTNALWERERSIPGVDPARSELLPFVGPPAFLPLWSLFSAMPFAYATLLWAAVLVLCSAVVAVIVLVARRALSWGSLTASAALGVAFAPLTSDIALGQAALLGFASCVGATATLRSRPALAGVWTLFAAVQPNIALLLLSQSARRRAVPVFAAALTAFALLCMLSGGLTGVPRYVQTLRMHGAAEHFALIQITPAAIAYGFGVPSPFATAIGLVLALAAIALWVVVLRSSRIAPLERLAAACVLLPFAVPFFHEHDFVVALLPVLLCTLDDDASTFSAFTTGGIMLVAIDWLGVAQRPEAFAQMALLAAAIPCALHALGDVPLRHLWPAPAALALLCGAHALALHTPAPVWPDAMRGASLLATPAQTWHEELARTGQFAVQPYWAGLRLLTLCGCALLLAALRSTVLARSRTTSTVRDRDL